MTGSPRPCNMYMGEHVFCGAMEISFSDKKLRKQVEDIEELRKKYGDAQAKKIIQRIGELTAAKNLYDIYKLPQARLHKLDHNLSGYFAVDVKQPYRLIIKPLDGNVDEQQSITKISIIKIEDYH